MMSSISRPDCARSDRPSALTTPAVTEWWNPYGFPIAIAICPTRTVRESPSVAHGRDPTLAASMRTTARSVSASWPTRSAAVDVPSDMTTASGPEPATTWLLVRIRPSGVKITPEPPPPNTHPGAWQRLAEGSLFDCRNAIAGRHYPNGGGVDVRRARCEVRR